MRKCDKVRQLFVRAREREYASATQKAYLQVIATQTSIHIHHLNHHGALLYYSHANKIWIEVKIEV